MNLVQIGDTVTATSKMGRAVMVSKRSTFDTGLVWNGQKVFVQESASTVAGKTITSWYVKTEKAITWAGIFKSAEKAAAFYANNGAVTA